MGSAANRTIPPNTRTSFHEVDVVPPAQELGSQILSIKPFFFVFFPIHNDVTWLCDLFRFHGSDSDVAADVEGLGPGWGRDMLMGSDENSFKCAASFCGVEQATRRIT